MGETIEGKRALWLMTQARVTERLVSAGAAIERAADDATAVRELDPVLAGDVATVHVALAVAIETLADVTELVRRRIAANIEEHAGV